MSEEDRLYENIITMHEIRCNSCCKTDFLQGLDGYSAAKDYLKRGWKATRIKVYCPECAKKKLKSRNV